MKLLQRILDGFESLKVARHFVSDLRPHLPKLAAIGGFSVLGVAFDLLRPWPMKWIVDEALIPATGGAASSYSFAPKTVIVAGVVGYVLAVLSRAGTQYIRDIWMAGVSHQFTRQLRFRIFSHLAFLSPLFHARHKSGDLLVRLMGDVPMVTSMMVDSSVEVITRSLFVVGTVTVMVFLDPMLTLAVFATVPIVLVLVKWISRQIHVAVRKQRRKEGDLADYLHEAIAATETIQSLGGSEQVVRRFARNNRRSARAGLKATKLAAKLSGSVESLLGVGLALAMLLGSFRVLNGDDLSVGDLLVFISYVRTLMKPVRGASKHAGKVAKGTACGERIVTILEADAEVTSLPDAPPAPDKPRELVFKDVAFRYDEANLALHDFNATFKRGELTALVGRSGAGKSTAASLAMRLMDPVAGALTIDGLDLKSYDVQSVRQKVGLCLQRTMLFGDSLRENLLLGAPEATDEEIWQALDSAGARGFVESLPEGLEAELGSNGVGLSGGQASRLSLARTLLRGASILIVDEPFAGLDRIASRQVSDTLKEIAQDRIVVVIAHDLERLDDYDHIVFMEEGTVIDQGRHADLLERLPLYRQVVRSTAEAS